MDRFELVEAAPEDGNDVWRMLQEIGPGENGFQNRAFGIKESELGSWLAEQIGYKNGLNLDPKLVPWTTFWLRNNGYPVGTSKLRHRLSPALLINGGHIGFCVRPTERGKGYSEVLLRETLQKALGMGIREALLTCDEGNGPSWRTMEKCGGRLEKIENGRRYYRIKTDRGG